MALPINTLASIIVLAGLSAAQAADVPTLNVERMCRAAAATASTTDYEQRCIKSEHAARDELVRQWQNFPPTDQQQCTALATLAGSASYVQLISCLESNRDARKSREKERADSQPPSLIQQQQPTPTQRVPVPMPAPRPSSTP